MGPSVIERIEDVDNDTRDALQPVVAIRRVVIAALRSRKYKQGQWLLRSADGECWCAGGVVLDVLDPNGWSSVQSCVGQRWRWHGVMLYPRESEWRMIGLPLSDSSVLGVFNYDEGKTFEEIAEWLETRPYALYVTIGAFQSTVYRVVAADVAHAAFPAEAAST